MKTSRRMITFLQSKNNEDNMTGFDRITIDPNMMGGKACIRGMRITVSLIINLIANQMSEEEILKEYPFLQSEDIKQSLQYAAWLADEKSMIVETKIA